jgi:hypothetical protein
MALTQLAPPYPIFTDKNGDPLDNGYLYFGVVNQNPETNPIQVYWDSALTQPAAQPIRTINGYPSRNGSTAAIYANAQFSVTVRNKRNELVIYSPVGYGIIPGTSATSTDQISYNEGAPGGVTRVLTSRLQDYVSVQDFGAVGDGVTDDTAAIQAAIDYCVSNEKSLYLGTGQFLVTQSLDLTFSGTTGTNNDFYRGMKIHGVDRVHTSIIGKTSGSPVFDMTGARLCNIENVQVRYDANDAYSPSCAFLLSRNLNNGGAGEHTFRNVGTFGYFTKTSIAVISSEVNRYYDCVFVNSHPDGHVTYISGQNTLGIVSSYISGLDTHSYSGGTTINNFYNCASMHFGVSGSIGQAIFLDNSAASPVNDVLFSGCYSITQPTSKASSITINGACADLNFISHRDESSTTNCFLIKAGFEVAGLRIIGGQYTRGLYGEDTSSLLYSEIYPQRMTGVFDAGVGQILSIDLYGFRFSNIFCPGNNGVRLRDDVTCSNIQTSNLTSANLFVLGTGTKLLGFRYSARNSSGSTWNHYTNGNIFGPAGFQGMTTNFMYMPSGTGAPSGTPADTFSGRVPFYYDETNDKFYVYNGSWKGVTLT